MAEQDFTHERLDLYRPSIEYVSEPNRSALLLPGT
jgi:hypothetical protein